MPNVFAVKSGNWSDTTLWNTGSLPTTVDDVFANNFTVYVDISPQVNFVTNLSGTGITAGGRFILNDTISLTANVIGGGANAVACVQFLSASPAFCTIYGSLCAVNTTIPGPRALLNNSSGAVTVYGNGLGRIKGSGNPGDGYIQNQSTGTINLFGNYIAGINAQVDNRGIWNQAAGTINLVGNLSGGVAGGSAGIYNNSTGTINVTGSIFGVGDVGLASLNGQINVVGNVIAGITTFSATTAVIIGSVRGDAAGGDGINTQTSATTTIFGDVSGWGPAANAFGAVNSGTGSLIIYGNIYGGFGTSSYGFSNGSTGSITVFGNVYGGNSSSWGGDNNGSGIVRVHGDVYGSNTTTNSDGYQNRGANSVSFIFGNVYAQQSIGVSNASTGTLTITGSVFGGNGVNGGQGARNTSTGTIIISGSAVGGNGTSTAYGAFNNSTGILRVKKAVGNEWGLGYTRAVASVPGVFSNVQGSQTFVEELELGPRGQWPTGGVIFFTPNTRATSMFETDTFQPYTLIQSNSADNLLPPVSSVRQGEVYDLGLDVGTCIIPPVSSVAAGTLVDNLTGTAVLTPQTTWSYPTTASDVDSMGGRLRNALNADSAEKLINSFSS